MTWNKFSQPTLVREPLDPGGVQKLFAQPCEFLLAAAAPEQFPTSPLPEIALIGRSNVGKSSLINAIVGRKKLARTSNTPGRTQQIVFFNLADRLMITDLPGYGFANAPKAEKAQWNALVQYYLRTRPKLRCVCLLIDGRHGILANDLEMMQLLDRAAAPYRVVLTKSDKVKDEDIAARRKDVESALKPRTAAHPDVLITSAEKTNGIEDLRGFLASFSL